MSELLMVLAFPQGTQPSPWPSLGLMAVVFAIFYFVVFAPMRKKQRQLQQLLAALKKGDKVVTTGGLYGEIAAIEGAVVQLKVADKVRIRIDKSAIARLEELGGAKK